ncbi:GDSL esterase/lipase At5g33370-like [Impatiens glandulifera]|uniref:GDSL esterase/lipase At5g33370-like n=1 Tax=Impatiens glandulifera TaxID=253017 RepID=UPI001FB06232|nr:GDSL esterase/lipase At5g33370-like [Impatiens glandulifera]
MLAKAKGQPPPVFVFGDSLVDNGNNNFLATTARADSPPYGIDSPTHRPSGRFSNGRNIPDFICEMIGAEHALPYLSPQLDGQRLLKGANFASAGIGILNDTGFQFVNIIMIYRQLEYFEQYQLRVTDLIGSDNTRRLVNSGLVFIALGGNDFVNNYYLVPFSYRSRQYNLPAFVDYLISEYQKILQRMYDIGARKVVVSGTGPLGCAPAERATRSVNGECSPSLQEASSLFNPRLVNMLNGLNNKIGSTVFIFADPFEMHMDFFSNPGAYGFTNARVACCGQGRFNGIGICTPFSFLCPNRDEFVFWDAYHPTEKAAKFIAQQIMNGANKYMHPMNLSTFLAV